MLKDKFCQKKNFAKGNFLLKDKFSKGKFLLRENFCLRTNVALGIGVLQFFEVPPGGSVVSPFFFPLFSLFFAFCFCCSGWVAFFFFLHFFFVICFFGICFAFFL